MAKRTSAAPVPAPAAAAAQDPAMAPAAAPAAQEPAPAPEPVVTAEEPKPEDNTDPEVAKVDTEEGFDFAGKTLSVRSLSQSGRRRAGMSFGPQATELQADDLDALVIALLLADPQLVVVIG